MDNIIKKIVSESINAPSGDNCQPWYFSIKESVLFIFKKEAGNNNYLDFESRGTLIAHGALIENICVVANYYGYISNIEIFPEKFNKDLISKISFLKNSNIVNNENLFLTVAKRSTNRRPYSNKVLSKEDKDFLLKNINNEIVTIDLIEDRKDKELVFKSVTQMEMIALKNKFLHSLFFKSIVWSKKEENEKRQGLYLKTMELPPPIEFFFKILRFWPVSYFFSKLGFSKIVAKANSTSYKSSQILIFSLKNVNTKAFIETGRYMELIWLRATLLGIAIQPLAGLLYIHQRLFSNKNIEGVLSEKEVKIVENNFEQIKSKTSSKASTISMILRIGYAKEPSATSSKKEPNFI